MKVSDFIAKFLKSCGVDYVYGCIGGAAAHLVDSIFREGLRFIHCYHEQCAAFAASASAKYSGRLKVAIATSGPGATNLITGIADAYFDSSPVLFITGQVNTYDFKYQRPIRQYGFQETDIVSIVRPITKYSVLLDRAEDVEEEMTKAVRIALSGRPGPVLVDIPMDVQRGDILPKGIKPVGTDDEKHIRIRSEDLEELYEAIVSSKRPLILAGGGCRVSKAKEALVSLAETLSIPAVVSLLGKDSFPNDHRLFAGFIGAYGNRYGNIAMSKSDLLLVLGSRLDSRQTGNVLTPFCEKMIFQVDLEQDETDQRFPNRKYIISDVRNFIEQFADLVGTKELNATRAEWKAYLKRLKQIFPPASEPTRAKVNTFHYDVMEEISRDLSPEDVVCVDIGQNQMLAAQVLEIKRRQRFITSGGMAPMGYALPAGVSIAIENGKRVVIIAGDGGMQLNIHELNTVGKLCLPIVIFVFNNKSLGMLKQFQDLYFSSRYCDTDESSGYYTPSFVKIAGAYGIKALRIDRMTPNWKKKVATVLREDTKSPILVQIDFDYPTHVYPKLEYDKPLDKLDPKLTEEEEEKIGNWIT